MVKTQTAIIDVNTISIENTSDNFVKLKDGSLWENVRQENGIGIYKRLKTNSLIKFFTPTNQELDNYNNNIKSRPLRETLKSKVNKELKNENFSCV